MSKDELIKHTDKAIAELVKEKRDLLKAYNYYNCKRDAELFKYLEENFGIGNPTSVEFVPLIKKHIDALVGEYLGTPILPKVTCKDSKTISQITREKQIKITELVFLFLTTRLKNKILESLYNDNNISDPFILAELDLLLEDLNYSFLSEYEIAAQNVIQWMLLSRDIDIVNKLRILIIDLLITGYMFYRVKLTANKSNIRLEVLNPLNTFIDRNPNSIYIKDSYRVVVRRWMTKQDILNEYGKELSKNDLKKIKETEEFGTDYSSTYIRSYTNSSGYPLTEGLRAGEEIVPGYPYRNSINYNLMPVYEVEWLETDSNFIMQRYKTVRIGESIYILYGKDDSALRSIDNPEYCSLSVNGVIFLNRDNEPYSMVKACMILLDKYDLAHFYRDNLMASSGSKGDFVDVSMIPKFLGDLLPERLKKWIAYKKQGTALIDTSQEGRLGAGQAPINTIFNGFDDSLRADAILACLMVIDSIEQTCSSITGVFRERLNGIQQRDAVTNVQTSVNNSFIVTKQYNHLMDTCVVEILLDCLNLAKIVFKNGLSGVLILGDKPVKTFTALPEHFTMSDFDIHIVNSSDINKEIEQLRAIIPEFIKSGGIDAELAIEAVTTKSLTALKQRLHDALRRQEKKNGQFLQAMLQVELLLQQLQEMQKLLQQSQQQVQQLNETKIQMEKEKAAADAKIEMYKAQTDRTYKEGIIRNDDKRTEIELYQMHDGNPYNDKVVQERHT